MTGIPVVSIGKVLGNLKGKDNYEIPSILVNGENGFYSDSASELVSNLSLLLTDKELSQKIGSDRRKTALALFSKQVVKEQWQNLFKSIV